MHAFTVETGARFVIMVGRESKYPASTAYVIAHEIGHIALGHASRESPVLDMEDPVKILSSDEEEKSADRFALEVLTGDPDIRIEANTERFSASQLAFAALQVADSEQIDPAILALCLAHRTGRWRQGFGSLKLLPPGEMDVGTMLNSLAQSQLDWTRLSLENQEFLRKVLGEL